MNARTCPRTASSNGSNQSLPANGDGLADGWRSFRHGVGSFSIVAIGTYAASANFHQPRDTTRAPGERARAHTTAAGGAETFAAGDRLAIINENPADATLADLSITFLGKRT